MTSLPDTLLRASQGDRDAEKQLTDYETTNYPEMANALATIIATDGGNINSRQVASLYLKNTLNGKSPAQQTSLHDRWKQIPEANRATVKETLVRALLSSNDPRVPRFAGIAVSEIACVELPFSAWPGLVGTLTQTLSADKAANGTTNNNTTQLAVLDCLGLVCERIEEVQAMIPDVPDLADETVNQMLTAIVQGVQSPSDDLRLAALQALHKSMSFVSKNMQVQAERDFIVKHAMCGAVASENPTVRKLAFQCLDVVADLYYEQLQDYMTQIFELTLKAIHTDPDEEVKQAAIEFWCTLAVTEEEALREEAMAHEEGRPYEGVPCKKYLEVAMPSLVPLLLETLSKQADEYDEDMYDLPSAGAICLETMSLTIKNGMLPAVIPFVQQNITSEDWHLRDAAIVAFTCILDGPATASLAQYIQQIIPVLMAAFKDNSEIVRDSATHCIATICKLHVEAISPEQVHGIIQGLMEKFVEVPRIAGRACAAIFNISTSLKEVDMPATNLLSGPMLPLMQALLGAMDRPDASDGNLRVGAMSAAAELITASAKDAQPILRDLLPAITGRMEAALRMEVVSNDDKGDKEQMLGLLCGLITALFQRLECQDLQPHADKVMELILQVLQVPNATCHEEAFLSVGAIATILEDYFAKYLPPLMPFLVSGLSNYQSHQLCIVSVGVVVDISTAVGGQIQPYCDQIMGALTECLKDGSAHRDTKPVVFSCFGDIAMAIGAAFEPYLQISSMLLMQAAQAPINADDEELSEFINRLRLSVLDAYTGIIMGLADGNVLRLIAPNVSSIMHFIQFLSTEASHRDDMCLQKAVALLGDIAQQMGTDAQIRQEFSQPFVQQIVQAASVSPDDGTRDIAQWTNGVVQQMLSV